MSVVSASFRSRVRAGVEPIARLFGRVGLTPNALTLIGLAIAVVGAYFAVQRNWLAAGFIVGFGAIFDLFDGALARASNRVTKFGAFFDSSIDRASEGVVYIGILWGLASPEFPDSVNTWAGGPVVAAAALVSGYMVSYVRARSESLGFSAGTKMAGVGIAPREVRMAILVVGLILANSMGGVLLMGFGPAFLELALLLITLLSVIATIQRILFTYNQSRSQTQEVNH